MLAWRTSLKKPALLLSVLMLIGLWTGFAAVAEEKPQYGGILRVAIAGDPPSLDMHQETTFLVKIPLSNCYNTLVIFDPHNFPEIIGDLAKSWTSSKDGMTWTFKLHEGVKFHDGSEMTSADVKASWDKIVWPPEGTISMKRSYYEMIKSIEAPDRYTVVLSFKLSGCVFSVVAGLPAQLHLRQKVPRSGSKLVQNQCHGDRAL